MNKAENTKESRPQKIRTYIKSALGFFVTTLTGFYIYIYQGMIEKIPPLELCISDKLLIVIAVILHVLILIFAYYSAIIVGKTLLDEGLMLKDDEATHTDILHYGDELKFWYKIIKYGLFIVYLFSIIPLYLFIQYPFGTKIAIVAVSTYLISTATIYPNICVVLGRKYSLYTRYKKGLTGIEFRRLKRIIASIGKGKLVCLATGKTEETEESIRIYQSKKKISRAKYTTIVTHFIILIGYLTQEGKAIYIDSISFDTDYYYLFVLSLNILVLIRLSALYAKVSNANKNTRENIMKNILGKSYIDAA